MVERQRMDVARSFALRFPSETRYLRPSTLRPPMRPSVLFALLLLLAACGRTETPPLTDAEAAEHARALAFVERVDREALDEAFDRLARVPHTVEERLTQLDRDGRPTAHRTRRLAIEGERAETVAADSAGTIDFGNFGRFLAVDDLDAVPANPVPHLFPDDPPYLTPQGREAYQFRFAADTTIARRILRVVTVAARPGVGDGQALRRAHLYVDPGTNRLVGLRAWRHSDTLLFGETSRFALLLRPSPVGWIPAEADYTIAVRGALTATRHFRLERRYEADTPSRLPA